MKFLTIIFLFFLSFETFAQEEKLKNLEVKVQHLVTKNAIANKVIFDLKNECATLNSRIQLTIETMNTQITRSQELQAQNERAMNLALDEFEKKFREQNETFSFVQNQLDKKFNTQLILLSIFMIFFIIIVFVMTRSVGQKAYTQNQANWNSFQEHLLKK